MEKKKERGTLVSDMKKKYRTVTKGKFADNMTIKLKKESDLRYGENPNQPAAVYSLIGTSLPKYTNIRLAKTGKGGLSATNMMDITRAMDILKFFAKPSVAVMKHTIPSGFATQYNNNSLEDIYEKARDADTRSAFGSVVVPNRPVDKALAEAILAKNNFVEVLAAPDYEEGTLDMLNKKKDLRLALFSNLGKMPKYVGDNTRGLYDIKMMPTGRLVVQKPYLSSIKGPEDLIMDPMVTLTNDAAKTARFVKVERDPTPKELEDLLTAWYVNIGVRSNGIVFVKDGVTVAVGSGQQERVGAIEHAVQKSYQKALARAGVTCEQIFGEAAFLYFMKSGDHPLKGAVMSSDAFFPFRDSIDTIAKHGVTAVIQPGGSVRDGESIEAVNEYKMAMPFTLERCFGHF